jgi:hypothetical protein
MGLPYDVDGVIKTVVRFIAPEKITESWVIA